MIDLISLVVTLIIMSLFGIGILLAILIMSYDENEIVQIDEDEYEAQMEYIHDYYEKKQQKKQARKEFINKIKKLFSRI